MAHRDPQQGRARDRERFRKRVAERIARGLCTKCGREPAAPARRLCAGCSEKRRAADRARYAEAKAKGALYGGRDPEPKRRNARERSRRRHRDRIGTLHPVREVLYLGLNR